jgi:hypothetical protein
MRRVAIFLAPLLSPGLETHAQEGSAPQSVSLQGQSAQPTAKRRPEIGGALGLAHIGVLQWWFFQLGRVF